ncbi:HAD-IB family phosphatase [Leeia oryzae]|uniref:HAD-IB family phosphatase n=1 Tax=Leeia oryzae TaxID=356662 RepID=UPI0003622E24|nr:HAD-IB family phosphatase [Leeia oryzae]
MLVSVIIPALNEEKRIADVVRFATDSKVVGEVIVIDDGSTDATAQLAREAGAYVITSSLLGKGASMKDGLEHAHFDLLVYLDGDLNGLETGMIERLIHPLVVGSTDFVKASFGRAGGRVTELTAKPLLKTFFPEVAHFKQPLGGIIAARKSLLNQLEFEDDYGVDIGLLLDAAQKGAKISEVNIGKLEHDSQSLENLSRMAVQVSRTIMKYARNADRFHADQVDEVIEAERQLEAEIDMASSATHKANKLAIFDMDGTLTFGRYIEKLAELTQLQDQLSRLLDSPDSDDSTRSHAIARLFKDVPKSTFVEAAKAMPLQKDAMDTIKVLKQNGYVVGIVSDSYYIAAEIIRKRVFADFALAHLLQFKKEVCTGGFRINPVFELETEGCQMHKCCKSNALHQLNILREEPFEYVIAIGDNLNDGCLLTASDLGFAFQPKHPVVSTLADHTIHRLSSLLDFVSLSDSVAN